MATIQLNCDVDNYDGNPPWLEIETTLHRFQAVMESSFRCTFTVKGEPPHGWYLEFGGKRERQPDPWYAEDGSYEGPRLNCSADTPGAPGTDPFPPNQFPAEEGKPAVQINCSVVNGTGHPPRLEIETNGHRYPAVMESKERAIFRIPAHVEPPHGWLIEYDGKAERQPDPFPTKVGAYEGPMLTYAPPVTPPPALPLIATSLVGRSYARGNQLFYPWYFTLFWALGGWMRGDRARVEQHFQWMANRGANGFRMLAQVDWVNEAINPDAPNYEAAFGEMLDAAFDTYGLMAKITLIGGGARDPRDLASKVRTVLAPRRYKVLLIEGVNEQNGSTEDAAQMLDILRDLALPMAAGFGNTGIENIQNATRYCEASVACMHTERGGGDDRQLRQVWDLKEFAPYPADDGEGPGPGASAGGECHDPVILAAKRAGAAAGGGAGMFCLHTGAGVYGRARPAGPGREACPANIWEINGIGEMTEAVRRACEPLDLGIENWHRYNTNMPVRVIEGPYDKHYGGRANGRFGQIITGCRNGGAPADRIVLTGKAPYRVWAPGGNVLAESEGGTVTVGGYAAYVVAGVDNGASLRSRRDHVRSSDY